ncbi:MAG: hypothetical protein LBL93_00165, partial [Ruminococcus sp.]|nr:hypothetical protein [Ruminococcus sp.]
MKKNETNITTTDNFANSTDVSKNADISAETEEIGREYILTCGYYFAGKDMPVGEFDIFALSGYGFVLSIGPHDNLLCISEHLGANTAHHTTSFKRVSLLEGGVLSVDINLELKIVFSKIVSGFPGQQFNQVGAVRIPPGDYSDGVVLPDSLYGPLKDDISENSKAKYIAAVAADKAKAANADTATDKAKVANADTSTDKVKAANADTIADTVTDIPPGKLGSIGREYILTCGHYFAGIDIPTGKFDVFVLDGYGEIKSSDADGLCALHVLLGDDGEPGLHSCEEVSVSEGGVFTVEKYLELKIVYSEITSGYSG